MKSLLQQVQSRISKRRDVIHAIECEVKNHYYQKMLWEVGTLTPCDLKKFKQAIAVGAASQKLDKRIYQALLKQERDKFAGYFRSSHKPVDKKLSVAELCEAFQPIFVENSQAGKGDDAWK